MEDGWIDKSLGELLPALRAGKVSPVELFEEASTRHAKYGNTLSAYRLWDETDARAQAERAHAAFQAGEDCGPLQGIPVSVKDLFGVSGLDTCAGSPSPLPEKWTAEGPVIKAIRDQGAVLTGKSHMVEFAFGGLGTNVHWPIPRNPWDTKTPRVSGGSSSGAGVSLWEGSALVALGTDTAGSVRVPASVTGTVGLKTTAGRWPLGGIVPLSPTLDTPGILTRTVADAALVFETIDAACAGRPPRPSAAPAELNALRIGIVENHFWDNCTNGIDDEVHRAIAELEKSGAAISTIDLPEVDEAFALFCKGSVVASEFRAFLSHELPEWAQTLDPNIAARMATALDLDSKEIADRRARMAKLVTSAAQRINEIDLIVSPTVQITPPPIADVADAKAYSKANLLTLKNTCIANILGLCAITLPTALDAEGMPVGLQCMAAGGAEERLLSAALAIEDQLGTARERLGVPPLVR